MKKNSFWGTKVFWIVIALSVIGQMAWGLENSWFNTFTYDEITTNAATIAWMNGASALTATITTFAMGARSDYKGKRKPFIMYGYILWGLSTGGFVFCKYLPNVMMQCVMVVVLDCIMTFFGSTAYDACFNAWTTDISDTKSRGQITSIVQIAPLISGIILSFAGVVIDNFGYSIFFWSVGVLVTATGWIAGRALQDSPTLKPNSTAQTKGLFSMIVSSFQKESLKENKELFLILATSCVLLCGFQVSYAYEMIYANHYLGLSKTVATFLTVAALPVMVIASLWVGKRCDQGKGNRALALAPILFVVGAFLHASTTNIVIVILARVFYYGGWMTMMVAATAMFKNLAPMDSRGRFEGVRMVFMVLIPMIVGPTLGSFLINQFALGPILYWVTGIVALFAYLPLFAYHQIKNKRSSSD